MYLSSEPDTTPSSVAIVKSYGKKCQNYPRVTTSPFAEMELDEIPDTKEQRNQQKDDGFLLKWGIFNEYIKQNIVMVELREANFYSVDICRLIKNQSCKKRSRKLIQILIFSNCKVAHKFLRRRNILHIIEFSLD